MKLSFKEFALMCILGTVILALGSVLLGSVWTGHAGEAATTANAAYEANFQITPMAPAVYPSEIVLACDTTTGQTVELIFQSRWHWEMTLNDPTSHHTIGACP